MSARYHVLVLGRILIYPSIHDRLISDFITISDRLNCQPAFDVYRVSRIPEISLQRDREGKYSTVVIRIRYTLYVPLHRFLCVVLVVCRRLKKEQLYDGAT